MSEKSSHDKSSKGRSGAFAAPAAFEVWAPALAGSANWQAKIYEDFARLGGEWFGFVARRLKEDLALPQQLCSCRAPEEAWQVYLGFWQKLVDDYQKEYAALARLGNGSGGIGKRADERAGGERAYSDAA